MRLTSGLTSLDFAQRAAPARGWRLALLAGALVALTASGANAIVQARTAALLQEQLERAQPRVQAIAALSPAQQRNQEAELKSVAEAVRQLNLPVARLMRAVQAPPDIRVALLGLDLAGTLKINAEGQSAQDMMNYLAYLNEQPMFTSVYLVKHELADSVPGRPYRFQLEARWEQ